MSTKRLPFGEAPHDLSNRSNSTSAATAEDDGSNPIKNVMIGNMRRRVERGKELKVGGRVGRALNGNTGSKATSAVNSKNNNANSKNNTVAVNSRADAKTRQLKAQAYSDKITIASQTQRIEALQAELEEVRQFASMEASWRSGDRHQEGGGAKDGESKDGELIEALAQELENTEKDLKVAQEAVGRLEMELMEERNKPSNNANVNAAQTYVSSVKSTSTATTQSTTSTLTPHSSTHSRAHVSIEELQNIVSAQKIQLQKSQQDAAEGLSIMRDLEKALRVARSERDAARMKRDEALRVAESKKGEVDGVRAELEGVRAALTSVRTELSKSEEMRGRLTSANKKQSEEYASLVGRYSTLENSLAELQSVLSVVQTRSEKKIAALHTALSAAEDREEKSALELSALSAKYRDVQGQCGEMEGVLTDLTERFQEVKIELTSKKEELEGLDKRYVGEMEEMKARHEEEMERVREEGRVLYGAMLAKKEAEWEAKMKRVREEEVRSRDEGFKVTEEEWRLKYKAEVEDWKLKLEKVQEEAKIALVERDELSRCQSENAKLKTEKNELLKKLERGMAMYNETTLQLKAKTAEAVAASTCSKGGDAELLAANKALKKDLTSAVESSISRGRQIQSLEKEVESYRVQLTKASQTIKRMEKSTPNSVTPVVNTDADEIHRLESEVKALKSRAQEAETQKQQLQDDISEISVLKLKASKVDSLEKDLQTSHLALTESQSRILSLQEALKATESALRAVSSTRLKGAPGSPKDDLRRQIEDLALKDYVGRRM